MRQNLFFAVLCASLLQGPIAEARTPISFQEVLVGLLAVPRVDSRDPNASAIREDIARYGTAEQPRLPDYGFSLPSLVNGDMTAAANRTFNDSADLRDYFPKLVHANGICFVGTWRIDQPTRYSGYFAQGSIGLFVGRASTATPQTTSDADRSFGFAGKVFPTLNAIEKVRTADFFAVDDLTGRPTTRYVDAAMTNEPPFDLAKLGFLQRLGFQRLQGIFRDADAPETVRPLYPVARLGVPSGAQANSPRWIQIRADRTTINESARDPDFRNELSSARYPQGLSFDILTSDTTKDAAATTGWEKIGAIQVNRTIVSFGCDRRLHFVHPRTNDPEGPQPSVR